MKKEVEIMLDLDDVLVDWTGACLKLHGLNVSNPKFREYLINGSEWGLDHIIDPNEMWKNIDAAGMKFWDTLEWLPWGKELYKELRSRYTVTICTACSEDWTSVAGKFTWLKREIGNSDFFLGSCKERAAHRRCVLIDDRPRNCIKFIEGFGHAVLWPRSTYLKYNFHKHPNIIKNMIAHIEKNKNMMHKDCEYQYGFYYTNLQKDSLEESLF